DRDVADHGALEVSDAHQSPVSVWRAPGRCHPGRAARIAALRPRVARRRLHVDRRGDITAQSWPPTINGTQMSAKPERCDDNVFARSAQSLDWALRWLLPDRYMLPAAVREGLTVPVAPTLAEGHSGESRHEVQFRRPYVAKRRRKGLQLAIDHPVVVRDDALRCDVVLVKAEVRRGHGESPD